MKGQLDIFLHDVNTGKDEHYQQHNLVTNACAKYIAATMMNYSNSDYMFPIATKMLGGLLVFDDELTENANNMIWPSDAHIVGIGGRNSTTATELRGSLNEQESGETTTGYKSTWDFTTSQCNKTIGAVALTSCFAEGFFRTSESAYHGRSLAASSYRPIYVDSNNYLYTASMSMASNTLTVTVYKSNVPISWLYGVSTKYNKDSSPSVSFTQISTKSLYVRPVTQYWSTCGQFGLHGDYLYFAGANYGSSFVYFTIKVSDLSFEISDLQTVTCDGCSFDMCGTSGSGRIATVSNNKFWITKLNGGSIYVIDIDNPTDIVEAVLPTGYTTKTASGANPRGMATVIGDVLFLPCVTSGTTCYNGIVYPDGTVDIDTTITYNTSTAGYGICYTEYLIPGTLMGIGRSNYNYGWGSAGELKVYGLKAYLGTICNLSSPVTKTSAQTMKIVYTLTDA